MHKTDSQTASDEGFSAGALRDAPAVAAAPARRVTGLCLGANIPFRALGVIGTVLSNAPTQRLALREAMKLRSSLRGWPLLTLSENTNLAIVRCEGALVDSPTSRFMAEFCLALCARFARTLDEAGGLRMVRVARQPESHELGELEGCPVQYEAGINELVLDRSRLDHANPFFDESLWDALRALAHQREAILRHENPLHILVLKSLVSRGVELSTPVVLARHLGLTLTTMRRRLRAEGHSLSELTERARMILARQALSSGSAQIKEIAHDLQYSEPSSFCRAFKRVVGESPAEYRARYGRRT